ncbi:MAG TPA: P1 family peptidase [Methylomirabilota bacterium]|nr:P1 family peptidase [Methylomirabilota bacterium]
MIETPTPPSLTAVRGISVGHYTDLEAGSGCTVVLAPQGGMRASGVVRGRATGTRELDVLDPAHLVGHVDAIFLTGGSAYGLGATDGVVRWLRDRGRGVPVHPVGVVPIVPAAVVFDLGNTGAVVRWPRPEDAVRACDAASTEFAEGSVGAGTGATVGKARSLAGATKGGLGTWAVRSGDVVLGALVVVNAVGDVRDARGEILAGGRGTDGRAVDGLRYLADGGPLFGGQPAARNTTLAVIATNAALTKLELFALAQAGSDALARRITPYGTLFDGDVVFAASTAAVLPASPLQAEALAALAVPEALERAVRLARGTAAVPGLAGGAP